MDHTTYTTHTFDAQHGTFMHGDAQHGTCMAKTTPAMLMFTTMVMASNGT